MKIAIDGPAASGKSTLGEALAKSLGYLYFDTGVMYRAVTLAVLLHRVDIMNPQAVLRVAETALIEVTPSGNVADDRQYTVWLDGDDVTWRLREPEIDAQVSIPSAYSEVRQEMVRQQRRIAARDNVVMVGRDIGTVVLPEADLKIYLDATVEERARRRYKEMLAHGQAANYEQVLQAMRQRDLLDTSREASPLKPAKDALIIDSTHRSVDDILAELGPIIARIQSELTNA
jgi:cytidylate kinase